MLVASLSRRSAVVVAVIACAAEARADLRSFTQTYEYSTMPEGRTAIELWHTQGRRTWDASSPQFFAQALELEHGVTDCWDVGVVSTFAQATGEPFRFAQVELESRYRLSDRGEWPVDTMLFLDVGKQFDESRYTLEGKVVGARDFGELGAVANLIAGVDVGNDVTATGLELGFAAGLTYQVHAKLRAGVESWGTRDGSKFVLSAGPALGVSPTPQLWLAVTAGFGIENADKLAVRAILGLEL